MSPSGDIKKPPSVLVNVLAVTYAVRLRAAPISRRSRVRDARDVTRKATACVLGPSSVLVNA